MLQISSGKFIKLIELDPAWAAKLTAPVEITDYCDMRGSKITHLSPLLHFVGKNAEGEVADFSKCKELKIAEGNFDGFVNFFQSGIERIDVENLKLKRADDLGYSAWFQDCKNLKVAEGNFAGHVSFEGSGIERIDPDLLQIKKANQEGEAAGFVRCYHLKVAEGTFPGQVNFSGSGIQRIDPEKLNINKADKNGKAASFERCENLKIAEGKYPGWVDFSNSGVEKITNLTIAQSDDDEPADIAAKFCNCNNLKVAEGTFEGFVHFGGSAIETINPDTLKIQRPAWNGIAAIFEDCKKLKILTGTYPGAILCSNSGIETLDERFEIRKPSEAGEHIQVDGSPITQNHQAMTRLVNCLFPLKDCKNPNNLPGGYEKWLERKLNQIDESEPTLKKYTQRKIDNLRAERKKLKAVEFEID